MTAASWAWARDWRTAGPLTAFAGLFLMGWIVVEVAFIRSISWLHPFFFVVGFVVACSGYRSWNLCWGATAEELGRVLPGDDLVGHAQFRATRAITVAAPPAAVWPWLLQVGRGRAGFYSYDRLDNGGRPSAREIRPEYQDVHINDFAAQMTAHPGPTTVFRVRNIDAPHILLWAKRDSTWVWQLTADGESGTRLVTRLCARHDWSRPLAGLGSLLLLELGDFPMMRKMLLGIRERAEEAASRGHEPADRTTLA